MSGTNHVRRGRAAKTRRRMQALVNLEKTIRSCNHFRSSPLGLQYYEDSRYGSSRQAEFESEQKRRLNELTTLQSLV